MTYVCNQLIITLNQNETIDNVFYMNASQLTKEILKAVKEAKSLDVTHPSDTEKVINAASKGVSCFVIAMTRIEDDLASVLLRSGNLLIFTKPVDMTKVIKSKRIQILGSDTQEITFNCDSSKWVITPKQELSAIDMLNKNQGAIPKEQRHERKTKVTFEDIDRTEEPDILDVGFEQTSVPELNHSVISSQTDDVMINNKCDNGVLCSFETERDGQPNLIQESDFKTYNINEILYELLHSMLIEMYKLGVILIKAKKQPVYFMKGSVLWVEQERVFEGIRYKESVNGKYILLQGKGMTNLMAKNMYSESDIAKSVISLMQTDPSCISADGCVMGIVNNNTIVLTTI